MTEFAIGDLSAFRSLSYDEVGCSLSGCFIVTQNIIFNDHMILTVANGNPASAYVRYLNSDIDNRIVSCKRSIYDTYVVIKYTSVAFVKIAGGKP